MESHLPATTAADGPVPVRAPSASRRETDRLARCRTASDLAGRYRDLDEFSGVLGLIGRGFEIDGDAFAQGRRMDVLADCSRTGVALAEAILPFEFFDVSVANPPRLEVAFENVMRQAVEVERLWFARTYFEERAIARFAGMEYPMVWDAFLVARTRVDGGPSRLYGSRLRCFEFEAEGVREVNCMDLLARTGPLNPGRRGGVSETLGEAVSRASGNPGEAQNALASVFAAERTLVDFCRVLAHRGSSAVRTEARVLSRPVRRRLAEVAAVDGDLLRPSPGYRIVVRESRPGAALAEAAAGRNLRYVPKRRHEVGGHLREFRPGRFTEVRAHQRGGGSGPGPDYLVARSRILASLGVENP